VNFLKKKCDIIFLPYRPPLMVIISKNLPRKPKPYPKPTAFIKWKYWWNQTGWLWVSGDLHVTRSVCIITRWR